MRLTIKPCYVKCKFFESSLANVAKNFGRTEFHVKLSRDIIVFVQKTTPSILKQFLKIQRILVLYNCLSQWNGGPDWFVCWHHARGNSYMRWTKLPTMHHTVQHGEQFPRRDSAVKMRKNTFLDAPPPLRVHRSIDTIDTIDHQF